MSTQSLTLTAVVEQMLDHASRGRSDALADVLAADFVCLEPDSLPYGGTHRGVGGYVALTPRRCSQRWDRPEWRSGGERGPEGVHDVLRPAFLRLPLGDPVVHEGAH